MSAVAEWIFEPADPEVGFLTDTITHACEENEDEAQPAVETDVRFWNATMPSGPTVKQQTTWTCPACNATTTACEEWPRWMFEEPRDEHEGR